MRKYFPTAGLVAVLGHSLAGVLYAQESGSLGPNPGPLAAESEAQPESPPGTGSDEPSDPDSEMWADLLADIPEEQAGIDGDGPVDGPEDGPEDASELAELSLEDLMGLDVEVTTVSRKAESRQRTAAAVHVITSEDLRRSGVRSIPDALRMAPGVRVTRLSSGRYTVTARGFTWEYADKILVMIDGRSVYSTLFSGTEWETLDLPIEEVERIEVIRGPGGTMWGSNAVNGVINIITKSAKTDQGESLTLIYGDEERQDVLLRGGIRLGEKGYLRAFARSNERDSLSPNLTGIPDSFEQTRFGLRGDFDLDPGESLMISAGAFDMEHPRGQSFASTVAPFFAFIDSDQASTGANLLGRWTKEHDSGSLSTLQGSVSYLDTDSRQIVQERTQIDLFYQNESELTESQTLVWGLAARYVDARFEDTAFIQWDSARRDHYFSGFLQDQIELSEKTTLTAGVKLEDNPFTGLEIQPSLRAAYYLNESTTFWGSVSRAIQTPSEVYRGARVVYQFVPDQGSGFDTSLVLTPDDSDDAESVLSFEAGMRTKLADKGSLDVSTFLNDYQNVRGAMLGDPFPTSGTSLELPLVFKGVGEFRTFGIEVASTYALTPDLVARGSYTFTHVDESYENPSQVIPWTFDTSTPKHMAHLGLSYNVAANWELDANTYFISRTSKRGAETAPWVRADVRLGWRPADGVTVTVAGQGLIHDDTKEITGGSNTVNTYGAQAGAYIGLRFEF